MLTATRAAELRARAGQELGVSDWLEVTQPMIDAFAEVTGDRQWIHTDPERARSTQFGGTIAHGYYTLALAPKLLEQVLSFSAFAMVVNYGLDKVRFPAPLPSGERVRMRVRLERVDELAGGALLVLTLTIERSGASKPVCVAEALYRVFDQDDL